MPCTLGSVAVSSRAATKRPQTLAARQRKNVGSLWGGWGGVAQVGGANLRTIRHRHRGAPHNPPGDMPALRLWWVTAQRILLVHRYRQRAPNPPYRDRGTWVRLRLTDISTLLGH